MSAQLAADLDLGFPGPAHFRLVVRLRVTDSMILTGPSGAGKTSILRAIAGLPVPAGNRSTSRLGQRVRIGSRTLAGEGIWLPAHARRIGYVFQDSRLLPQLSVAGNLDYAIHRSAFVPQARNMRLQIITQSGIAHLLHRLPRNLSAGERQRVALARALLQLPDALLLDEPFSALDLQGRHLLIEHLAQILQQLDIPALFVSHDADELLRLTDRALYLDAGRLVAEGSLMELKTRLDLAPTQDAAAIVPCTIMQFHAQDNLTELRHEAGVLLVLGRLGERGEPCHVRVLARDVAVSREPTPHSSVVNQLPVTLVAAEPGQAGITRLRLAAGGGLFLLAHITNHSYRRMHLQPGNHLYALIKGAALQIL